MCETINNRKNYSENCICSCTTSIYTGYSNATPKMCNCKILMKKKSINDERILKSLWMSDYSEDYFQTLLESESRRRSFKYLSPQDNIRLNLLALMKTVVFKLKLSRITLHLAMYLIDSYMDEHKICARKLNLAVLTCLLLATKIEETEVKQPKLSQLEEFFDHAYSLMEYKHFERKILKFFKFNLILPTVVTFIEFYANRFVSREDFETYLRNWHSCDENSLNQRFQQKFQTYNEMVIVTRFQLLAMTDLALDKYFLNLKPSLIAISCIVAIRRIYNIKPFWVENLPIHSEYSEDLIAPIVYKLINLHNINASRKIFSTPQSRKRISSDVPFDSPDSGILTDVQSESEDEEMYISSPLAKKARICLKEKL